MCNFFSKIISFLILFHHCHHHLVMIMENPSRWFILTTLFISMAFLNYHPLLTLASQTPTLHEVENKPMFNNPKTEVEEMVSKSAVEASAREVPTGPNPIHHHRAPLPHFL